MLSSIQQYFGKYTNERFQVTLLAFSYAYLCIVVLLITPSSISLSWAMFNAPAILKNDCQLVLLVSQITPIFTQSIRCSVISIQPTYTRIVFCIFFNFVTKTLVKTIIKCLFNVLFFQMAKSNHEVKHILALQKSKLILKIYHIQQLVLYSEISKFV